MLSILSKKNIKKDNFMLRKTKSFNKSRYSRNRQYYRTGVFLCLWANIIFIVGAYYLFFRLTLKFSYFIVLTLALFSLVMLSYFSRNLVLGLKSLIVRSVEAYSFRLIYSVISLTLKSRLVLDSNVLPHLRFIAYRLYIINMGARTHNQLVKIYNFEKARWYASRPY